MCQRACYPTAYLLRTITVHTIREIQSEQSLNFSLLKTYCIDLGQDWEEGLPLLMLLAREMLQESTSFSPNTLVFVQTIRGSLAVLLAIREKSVLSTNLID